MWVTTQRHMATRTAPNSSDEELADEIERSLRDDLCGRWFPRVIDSQGGYVECLDHRWLPIGDARRSLIHQARLAWTAAAYAGHDSSRRDEFASYALHGMRFIDTRFRDTKHGGFYFDIDSAGRPLRNGEKHACALAYAVFAGAECWSVTRDALALKVALDASAWLEQHCHQANGTYIEDVSREGSRIMRSESRSRRRLFGLLRTRPTRNPLGRPYGQTTMNTHIHLLEAYAAFHRADPSPASRLPLESLLAIVRDRFVDDAGRLADRLDENGYERIGFATYGHAVETAALLLDAAESLGSSDDRTLSAANRLATTVLEHGRDKMYDGTFDDPNRDNGDKTWWVLAEALNTWAVMYQASSRSSVAIGDPATFRQALVDEWEFIRDHLVDRESGGWFKQTSREGTPRRSFPKSDSWVDPYHNGRALMNAVTALRETGQPAGNPLL